MSPLQGRMVCCVMAKDRGKPLSYIISPLQGHEGRLQYDGSAQCPRRRTHPQCPLQRHERRLQYENITAKRCSDCETASLFVRPRAPAFLLPLLPPSPFLVPRRFYAGVVPLRPLKTTNIHPFKKKNSRKICVIKEKFITLHRQLYVLTYC